MKKISMSWIIISIVVSYSIGMLFPIKNIVPILKKTETSLSPYELYSLAVNGMLALITFLAMLVALLKEEIVYLWRKPKLAIAQNENSSLLSEHIQDDSNTAQRVADRYNVIITIENKNKVDAKNIKIQISNAIFINHNTKNKSKIPFKNKIIKVGDNQNLSMYSMLDLNIASLKNVQIQKEKCMTDKAIPRVSLFIGENELPDEYCNGEIKIYIVITCEGGYALKKCLSIRWDGKWENRLSDISPTHLEVTLKDGEY